MATAPMAGYPHSFTIPTCGWRQPSEKSEGRLNPRQTQWTPCNRPPPPPRLPLRLSWVPALEPATLLTSSGLVIGRLCFLLEPPKFARKNGHPDKNPRKQVASFLPLGVGYFSGTARSKSVLQIVKLDSIPAASKWCKWRVHQVGTSKYLKMSHSLKMSRFTSTPSNTAGFDQLFAPKSVAFPRPSAD